LSVCAIVGYHVYKPVVKLRIHVLEKLSAFISACLVHIRKLIHDTSCVEV